MKTFLGPVPPRLPLLNRRLILTKGRQFLQPQWVLTGAVVAFATVLLFCFEPSRYPGYPLCLFHQFTGLLCPGCGSLRALHQLLHGHVLAALHLNALLVVALPLLAVWGWRCSRAQMRPASTNAWSARWFWCGVAVVVLFGILRNLPFARNAWLAP